MLFNLLSTLFLSLLLVHAAPLHLRNEAQHPSNGPVRWHTNFGGSVPADSDIELKWTGGDGHGWVSLIRFLLVLSLWSVCALEVVRGWADQSRESITSLNGPNRQKTIS